MTRSKVLFLSALMSMAAVFSGEAAHAVTQMVTIKRNGADLYTIDDSLKGELRFYAGNPNYVEMTYLTQDATNFSIKMSKATDVVCVARMYGPGTSRGSGWRIDNDGCSFKIPTAHAASQASRDPYASQGSGVYKIPRQKETCIQEGHGVFAPRFCGKYWQEELDANENRQYDRLMRH